MASVASKVIDRLKPTPTSELSTPRKVLRGFNILLLISALAMGVSAATASSDWEVGKADDGSGEDKADGADNADTSADGNNNNAS